MKPIISNFELFEQHISFFTSKFMTKDLKFKASLSSILSKEHLIKKVDGFEYTYGHLKDLDFFYSVLICPETLEGYLLIHFPSIRMNKKSYVFHSTRCFKHLDGVVDVSFDLEKKKDFFELVQRGEEVDNTLENLIHSVFLKYITHIRMKRKDQTMKIFTAYLLSIHFNYTNEINPEKFKMITNPGLIQTLYIQEFLRENIDKVISKKISFYSLINLKH